MDDRLLAKILPIEQHAHDCGWDTARNEQTIDGCEAVQLVGTTTRGNPEAQHGLDFGFSAAFGINEQSGRAVALRFDGKPNAAFVMTVEDGTGRYWHGPLNSYKRALDDPEAWTGVEAPAPISR